jgi:hypothetical protein
MIPVPPLLLNLSLPALVYISLLANPVLALLVLSLSNVHATHALLPLEYSQSSSSLSLSAFSLPTAALNSVFSALSDTILYIPLVSVDSLPMLVYSLSFPVLIPLLVFPLPFVVSFPSSFSLSYSVVIIP